METELFRIGAGSEFTALRDAELFTFANDLKSRYANDGGAIKIVANGSRNATSGAIA